MTEQNKPKIGDKFNFLTIIDIKLEQLNKTRCSVAYCLCDCGNTTKKRLYDVASGRLKSCGCYNRTSASQRMSQMNKESEHGLVKHPLYQSWKSMLSRHRDSVIIEWLDFIIFYQWAISTESYQEGLVLTRYDKKLCYGPSNCYFVNKNIVSKNNLNNGREKAKETSKKRYGTEYPNQSKDIKNKTKETNIKKYGGNSPMSSKEVRDKIKKTNLEKYGTECVLSSQKIKDKIIQTNLTKYGVKYPSESKEIRQRQIEGTIDKYGKFPFFKSNSSEENKLRTFVNSFGENFVSDYTILEGKEIDLFSDRLKLAIEYCGLYWHNEDSPEPRNKWYHYNKYNQCLNKKIRLITIYSDEWLNRNAQVKNLIKSILGVNQTRIFARKCSIIELDKKIARKFINNNHIQECKIYAKVYFGLVYNEKLVGVLSLRNHHRKSLELVLDRLCFLDEHIIIGGASKLLKVAATWAKNNNYKQIISWSDNRYSQGNVYEKIGFILDQELPPDYSYVSSNKKYRISKQSMAVKAGICEKKYAQSLGCSRIWDCGKKRYIYNIV